MSVNNNTNAQILVFILLLMFAAANHCQAEPGQASLDKTPLKFGFFPIVSTVALYKRFSPLRNYLSQALERDVTLLTAKDFPTFYQRTQQRHYDIVVTAPHFAVAAADSGKYRIRSTLTSDVQQLIIVQKNSPIADISELQGKVIATPPKPALITMMGKQFLKNAGIDGDKAPVYRSFTSHNAANQALLGGEVDAAIASSNIVKKAIQRGEPLRIISYGLKLPNMALLVAEDQNPLIGDRLVKALLDLSDSEKGKAVLKKISFPGYREVSKEDYEIARPYMEQARAISKNK